MKITICGSIKFMRKMEEVEKELKENGHEVFMPVEADGVDYWAEEGEKRENRINAKRDNEFMRRHFDWIKNSDAILVVNETKNDIKNYIGANTLAEIVFAYYHHKNIFFLNPIPDQNYIFDEIKTVDPIVINGDLNKINQS